MIKKTDLKKKAILLRIRGFTYNEILNEVKVAKSTLSLWLRSVKLAKKQKQRLTFKRNQARLKAIKAIKDKRERITSKLIDKGIKEVGKINKRELFLLGCALYWAEGSKQKDNNISQVVVFSNSDPGMIKVFIYWLKLICGRSQSDIKFELYIHELQRKNSKNLEAFWRKYLNLPKNKLIKIRFKRNIVKKKRSKNERYRGLLRIVVLKSTNLNRRILGWNLGIVKNIGEWCNR